MSIDWNLYLARYQQARGGDYFGASEDYYDGQLVLTEGEKTPLIVWLEEATSGRSSVNNLKARTMVQLNGDYTLHIRAQSLVGRGVKGFMNLVGEADQRMDYGFPEATRGRIITTDNKPFTKLVLGDLALRNALIARKREYLKVLPAPRKDGWHVVETGAISFEGTLTGNSPWSTDLMYQDTTFLEEAEREALLQAGSEHFNAQMDGFLDFLRAARDAVTAWRL